MLRRLKLRIEGSLASVAKPGYDVVSEEVVLLEFVAEVARRAMFLVALTPAPGRVAWSVEGGGG